MDRLLGGAVIHLVNSDPPYNVKVEPRSNNAIAAGLSSFTATQRKDASAGDQQAADLHRYPEKSRPTHKKLRAKDRPLANDFVSDEEFDRLLAAWFGNMARVLIPGGGFYLWGGYANCATLARIMAHPAAPPASRVAAASTLLKFSRESIELDDLAQRLEALERAHRGEPEPEAIPAVWREAPESGPETGPAPDGTKEDPS